MGRECVLPLKSYNYIKKLMNTFTLNHNYFRSVSLDIENIFVIDVNENDKLVYGIESIELELNALGELKVNKIYINTNFYTLNFKYRKKINSEIILNSIGTINSINFEDYICLPNKIECDLINMSIYIDRGLICREFQDFLFHCQNCRVEINDLLYNYKSHTLDINDFLLNLEFKNSNDYIINNLSIVVNIPAEKKLVDVYKEFVAFFEFKRFENTEFNLVYGGSSKLAALSNLFFIISQIYSVNTLKTLDMYNRMHLYVFEYNTYYKNIGNDNDMQSMLERFLKTYKYIFSSAVYKNDLTKYEKDIYLNKISLF